MRRPDKWTDDASVYIRPETYDMYYIHKFVKRGLKGTSADIKTIKLRDGLKETGFYGLSDFDGKEITMEAFGGELGDEFFVTLFHEIFHFFFRDGDSRESTKYENDIEEENRVEKSAENMLEWYKEHDKEFEQIKKLVKNIPYRKLTQQEKEDI